VRRRSPLDRGDSFAALADETRRGAIRALMDKPMSAGELARYLAVSPQALSRHLRVLRKAGLVAEAGLKEDARVRIYRARPVALEPVQEWLWAIEDIWRRQLDSFKTYAESNHRTRRTRS
jgi:DNA-binding transcriptional ArsR family regulator